MRGARRLGALFACVASIVAALEGEALLNKQKLLNRGFTLSLDDGGNPVYVKIGTPPEVVTVDVTEKLTLLRALSAAALRMTFAL